MTMIVDAIHSLSMIFVNKFYKALFSLECPIYGTRQMTPIKMNGKLAKTKINIKNIPRCDK